MTTMPDDTLIMEDVLLLMMDDRTGVPAGAATLHHTLAGAVLVELALLGRIRSDEDRAWHQGSQVVATGDGPLPDPLLQATYDMISAHPQHIHALLATIGFPLSEQATERLVRRGLLRRERKRFLGLFPTTSLAATDTGHESALREQVRAVLEDDARPDARLAAVIAVISASGTLVLLHPVPRWSGRVATRAKDIEQGHRVAVALNTAVTQTVASQSAATSAAAGTAGS